MKKLAALVLIMICAAGLAGCGRSAQLRQGENTQYFFTAKVTEVRGDCLLLEVFDTGNTNLCVGAAVEVLTEVVSADGCPEFAAGEYARVLMAQNTGEAPAEPLKALAIYMTDETGRKIVEVDGCCVYRTEKTPYIRREKDRKSPSAQGICGVLRMQYGEGRFV